ncbi:hypothetical protein [Actinomadura sp. NTSP31]|uniref:hypothetical protein n=1 Tax=Actinomadura sp. NTSP31 TaxID=1735447 RepID=UPI0035C02125
MTPDHLESMALIIGGAMTVSLAFGFMLGAAIGPALDGTGGPALMGGRESKDQKEIESDGQQKGRPVPPDDPGKGTGKRGK